MRSLPSPFMVRYAFFPIAPELVEGKKSGFRLTPRLPIELGGEWVRIG
jgi:hypothetical protein